MRLGNGKFKRSYCIITEIMKLLHYFSKYFFECNQTILAESFRAWEKQNIKIL